MVALKRKAGDENAPPQFSNISGPYVKRIRRLFKPDSKVDLQDIQNQRIANEAKMAEAQRATEAAAARQAEVNTTKRVAQVLAAVSETGYGSLAEFLTDLMTTKDRVQSSQVSKMLIHHGDRLLDLVHERQPALVNDWAVTLSGQILAKEANILADYLHPPQGQEVSEVLATFSLDRILSNARKLVPHFCDLLQKVCMKEKSSTETNKRKDCDLVSTLSILLFYH
jgi:hypothetical protein